VDGAATASTAVLAITRRLPKSMMRGGDSETTALQNKYYFKLWDEFDEERKERKNKVYGDFCIGKLRLGITITPCQLFYPHVSCLWLVLRSRFGSGELCSLSSVIGEIHILNCDVLSGKYINN
jgi:hypothetical protein